jgi:S-adenosylmethionine:tRNA ribosyltransferase-isomerase
MDEERYEISEDAARRIMAAKKNGGRIVAVGSTSVRTLETAARDHGGITACSGRSDIFIYPPYQFGATDIMLTNFHLPKSTLLMMVSALAGRDLIMQAYAEAVHKKYRFFSYGDCMLIL